MPSGKKVEQGFSKRQASIVTGVITGLMGIITGVLLNSSAVPHIYPVKDLNGDGVKDAIVYYDDRKEIYLGWMDDVLGLSFIPKDDYLSRQRSALHKEAEKKVSDMKNLIDKNLAKLNPKEE